MTADTNEALSAAGGTGQTSPADVGAGIGRPKLPRGVRLRWDEVRGMWMMLAPERVFRIDDTAAEILKLCDGNRTFADIVAAIAEKYAEAPEVIAADIAEMLRDLANKRVLEL